MEYPFQLDGSWHNGKHEAEKDAAVLPYIAEKIAFRNIENYFFPDRGSVFIGKDDYDKLTDDEKKHWLNQNGLFYKVNDNISDNIFQKICKRLGFVANGNFLLLKHSVNVPHREFAFYSMYTNLRDINKKFFKLTGNEKISYIDERLSDNSILFPNTFLARGDISYKRSGNEKYYQIDYFITHGMAEKLFQDKKFLLSGNECCLMDGYYDVYREKKENINPQIINFQKGTFFDILEFPDEQRYINIAKVKPSLFSDGLEKVDFESETVESSIFEVFFVELDTSVFKEVYKQKKRMLKLKNNSAVQCYESNPAFSKMEKQERQKKINLTVKKRDVTCQNKEYIKLDEKYFYYKIENDLYVRISEDFSECHADLCSDFFFLRKADVERIDATDGENKFLQLKDILEKKFDKNVDVTKCLIEHPSEWNGKDLKGHEKNSNILHKKIQLWDSNNKNGALPKDIQDCSSFCYFYAKSFESFLAKLHRNYADKLRRVQDMVMQKWMYKQGNLGLYPGVYGPSGESGKYQTYCNHAVFETIIRVDGNFNNFTNREVSTKSTDRSPQNERFPEFSASEYKKIVTALNIQTGYEYPYKKSNYWCDILEYQSKNPAESGICRISAEQAFYMARLGYVVIASWKNLETDRNKNRSPHFVTVQPSEKEYQGIELLQVAHVGRGTNKFLKLKDAFGSHNVDSILFYCNIKQLFI